MSTAVLVDGSFFIKRYRTLHQKDVSLTPKQVAKNLHNMCLRHVSSKDGGAIRSL